MRRIGLFGGTFDPPHLGHMILAAEAADQLQLESVQWLITPVSPYKVQQTISPFAERVDLVRACIQDEPKFQVNTIENERPGPHYTWRTLEILKERCPDWQIVLLLGGDSLYDLPQWSEPKRVLALVDQLGVMKRPDDSVDMDSIASTLPEIRSKIVFVDAPLLEISATRIRQRIADGHHYRHYLKDPVWQLIKERGYYQP